MILGTRGLRVGRLVEDDAPFMLAVLNDEAFIRFIGDRKVRTDDEARVYIRNGAMASYESNGFGLYLVESKELGTPILTFGPPDGPSFFGPVINRIPRGDDAVALWDFVSTAARFPGFSELKRSVRGKPETS